MFKRLSAKLHFRRRWTFYVKRFGSRGLQPFAVALGPLRFELWHFHEPGCECWDCFFGRRLFVIGVEPPEAEDAA